jgi:FkbM family methyltransferase
MPLTLRRAIIRALDRPGGRFLLSKMATRYARSRTNADIAIYFDEIWIHRVGTHTFPDSLAFDYYADAVVSWTRQLAEYYRDAADYWFHIYKPKAGDVIVDVGAGHGEDTLPFSTAVGPTGRVLAVEAHPTSFLILRRFCELNGLVNVKPLHYAIVDRPSTVYIDTREKWETNAVRFDVGDRSTTPVRAVTVDDLCEAEQLTTIHFLKINIEGAETLALRGLQRLVSRVEHLAVACHDFRAERGDGEEFRTRAAVIEILRGMGFALALRDDDPRPYVRDHVHAFRSR